MTTVALGEIVDFYSGGTPSKAEAGFWNGDVPWISAKDMKYSRLVGSIDHVSEDVFTATPLRKLPAGTVVMVVRGMILAHTVPIGVLDVDAAINQDLKALLPRKPVVPQYLAAMLRAQHADILARVSTAAHGTKKLESRVLEEINIPLPTIDEQRRIAGILERADALRAKRREALALLDDLTQSIFLDMFGAGKFKTVTAGVLMPEMRNGLSPATGGMHPARVLTLSALTRGSFIATAAKDGFFAMQPPRDKRVSSRDFLMCRGNGNKALVGLGVYSTEDRADLVFPDTVIAGRVDPTRVELPFLEVAWRQPQVREQIEAAARTTNGTYKVNQQALSGVSLPLPSLELQRQFVQRASGVASIRERLIGAAGGTNALFASLQQRAFAGLL